MNCCTLSVFFHELKAEYVQLGESSERSVEYPDSVDRADSEVADRMELDIPDRPDPGLEKRRGPKPLQPSSSHDEPDSGLCLVRAPMKECPLPFTVRHIKRKRCQVKYICIAIFTIHIFSVTL